MKNKILVILTIFFSIFIGIESYAADTNLSCKEFQSQTIKVDNTKSITYKVKYVSVGDKNVSKDKLVEYGYGKDSGGVYLTANESSSIASKQAKLNKDGSGTLVVVAQAVNGHYPTGIDVKIEVNGKDITGGYQITTHCQGISQSGGSLTFQLILSTKGFSNEDEILFGIRSNTGLTAIGAAACTYDEVPLVGALAPDYCDYGSLPFATKINFKASQAAASAGNDSDKQANVMEENTTIDKTTTRKNKKEVEATEINDVVIKDSQKIACGKGKGSLRKFISKYWSYFLLGTPVLLIVMVSLDFAKALFSSDQDLLRKAVNDAVKRTLAAILLLVLPVIISTILGFFGIDLCI